uniref:Uncharacterized protein n=1 Tax=Opuntia streptacantha TaxID=393608 RepID=A0A7C9EXZ9_OPUST
MWPNAVTLVSQSCFALLKASPNTEEQKRCSIELSLYTNGSTSNPSACSAFSTLPHSPKKRESDVPSKLQQGLSMVLDLSISTKQSLVNVKCAVIALSVLHQYQT